MVDSARCVVVERHVPEQRKEFLKELLELNHYVVMTELEAKETPGVPDTYLLGVTDVTFNPVIALYEGALKTRKNRTVSLAYWLQETNICDSRYWVAGKKNLDRKM